MGTRSTVRKLPPELKRELDRLLTDGRHTFDEVTDHLRKLGAEVSRSAIYRYSLDAERFAEDIRLAREMAQAVGRQLEDVPDADTGRLAIESLQALILRARMQVAKPGELDIEEVAKLARAVKDLQSAQKSSVDTEIKVRERALRDAVKAVESVVQERGLSEDTAAAIRAQILGVQRAA